MNKKLVIGGIVLLLVIGGGLFLLFGGQSAKPEEDSGSDTIPTQWSQAGDYVIQQIPDSANSTTVGTVILNEKAGFSFKVPDGWDVEHRTGEITGEHILNMLSQDVAFQKDEFGHEVAMLGGCVMSFETEYQKDTVIALSARIASVGENPSRYERNTSREEVVEISGSIALKTFLTPPIDSEYYKQFGESVRIELSPKEGIVVRFGVRFLEKDKENCLNRFEEFSNDFEI